MAGFWICILVFTLYGFQQTHSQSLTPEVYQPDKILCVDIGTSVTLHCCIFGKSVGIITWYKQPNRKQPQTVAYVFKTDVEIFYKEFKNPRFKLERSTNCSSMTISNIILSDEAVYYCAIISPYSVFGNGTYLKIKETSKPALCDHSVVCEQTLHGNRTNMNTQETTVKVSYMLSLGTALGLCVILIFCLMYLVLRKRNCDEMNTSIEDSTGMRQESEAETLNYVALHFSKRKMKAENRKPGSSSECVYSFVK